MDVDGVFLMTGYQVEACFRLPYVTMCEMTWLMKTGQPVQVIQLLAKVARVRQALKELPVAQLTKGLSVPATEEKT